MHNVKKTLFKTKVGDSFTPKWIGGEPYCVQSTEIEEVVDLTGNTGYKAFAKLQKVTDDGTNRPLDINNELCSETGLPQTQKDNDPADPNYIPPVYDLDTCPIGNAFNIKSTRMEAGIGTLEIEGGEPGETVDLLFEMNPTGDFNSLSFGPPVNVQVLDPLHVSRPGTMLLDGSGAGVSNYEYDPLTSTRFCLVTVTARSSGLPEGIGDNTNVA